ncbi:MAG: hypothetical protein KatS3mg109_0288 [Pirellulaceae bacterium]|nr:MAG: hypothetical protein KatS3mg109_0288 [Pirellulaceae bacterium]
MSGVPFHVDQVDHGADEHRAIRAVAERLLGSPNVCDQRKGRDLARLLALSDTAWHDRLALQAAVPLPDRCTLGLVANLTVTSLAWRSGQPVEHSSWKLLVAVEPYYPLAMPAVRFVDEVPYNPHVLHREHLPDEATLAPPLRLFIAAVRQGYDGGCCYLESSHWQTTPEFDLAFVIWQVSRVLAGVGVRAEPGALNQHACDYFMHLADQKRLPLGPPLPPPFIKSETFQEHTGGSENRRAGTGSIPSPTSSVDIEWIEEQSEL